MDWSWERRAQTDISKCFMVSMWTSYLKRDSCHAYAHCSYSTPPVPSCLLFILISNSYESIKASVGHLSFRLVQKGIESDSTALNFRLCGP
ncbi:hypothetical protein J6590_035592 [Homalodisca vitripennis]|nr:hypothetical protein J6590_035592 [Homalodisca vitripennis]